MPLYCASYWARGWRVAACMLAGCADRRRLGALERRRRHLLHLRLRHGAPIRGTCGAPCWRSAAVIAVALLASLQIAQMQMRFLFLMPILTVSLPVGIGRSWMRACAARARP